MIEKTSYHWLPEEDTFLADTIIEYIATGKTQLAAFADSAECLGRTSEACGFRWNATLRKQYTEQIKRAKIDRAILKGGDRKEEAGEPAAEAQNAPSLPPEDKPEGEDSLGASSSYPAPISRIIKELDKLNESFCENERLRKEIKRLESLLGKAQHRIKELEKIEADYQEMASVFLKAREMMLVGEGMPSGAKYKMDENGNLERLS